DRPGVFAHGQPVDQVEHADRSGQRADLLSGHQLLGRPSPRDRTARFSLVTAYLDRLDESAGPHRRDVPGGYVVRSRYVGPRGAAQSSGVAGLLEPRAHGHDGAAAVPHGGLDEFDGATRSKDLDLDRDLLE